MSPVVLLVLLTTAAAAAAPDRIALREITALTLQAGELTTARRTPAVYQLQCRGSACTWAAPHTVQCVNTGNDGVVPQWACTAELRNGVRFGPMAVVCEGYDHAGDSSVLAGSCALEYELEIVVQHSTSNSPAFVVVCIVFVGLLVMSLVAVFVYMVADECRSATTATDVERAPHRESAVVGDVLTALFVHDLLSAGGGRSSSAPSRGFASSSSSSSTRTGFASSSSR
jgi:hypothetical protein